jgi:hypothetical protein
MPRKPRKRKPLTPLIIRPPAGGMYIISPAVLPPGKKPRPLSELLPEVASKMIRQHDGRDALRIFGPHHWGEELVRRHKVECKNSGRPYHRDKAIEKAADCVGLDFDTLRNWMRRSKRTR